MLLKIPYAQTCKRERSFAEALTVQRQETDLNTLRKFLHEDWLRYPLEKLMDRLATGHPSRAGARDVVLRALKMNISLCKCNFI